MPSQLHNTGGTWAERILRKMAFSGFLTLQEYDYIYFMAEANVTLPSMPAGLELSALHSTKSVTAATKQPDAAFQFRGTGRQQDVFPCVVFEVGFSQSHESLVEDARQWLVRTSGQVKLVILIKLEEGKLAKRVDGVKEHLRGTGATSTDGRRIQGAENTEQDDIDNAVSPSLSFSSDSSTAERYQKEFDKCVPARSVGRITGFIELYRFDPATKSAYLDGPRVYLFPADGSEPQGPQIKITDLLPITHITGNPNRMFQMQLKEYCDMIKEGEKRLAFERGKARHRKRKRKKVDDSGEYGLRQGKKKK